MTGPPPPPAPKRKRKLPGGHLETEEKPDYLTYREIALLALQKEMTTLDEGVAPDAKATAAELTDKLFAHYDAIHAAEWDAELTRGQALAQSGDPQGATDVFGAILAHDPSYPRRGEMVAAFEKEGEALYQRGDIARAVGYFRQAVDLDPTGPLAAKAGARAALCDGRTSGMAERYRDALRLDPALDEAKRRLVGATEQSRGRWPVPLAMLVILVASGAYVVRRYRAQR